MKKLIAAILAVCLVSALSVGAVASNISGNQNINIFYNSDGVKVDGFEDASGNTILRQYENGVLVQRNTIRPNNKNIIEREFFDSGAARSEVETRTDTIQVSDYITIQEQPGIALAAAKTLAGTIKYRALIDTGYINYGLKCSYSTVNAGSTTYTINGFAGTVVDLVSLLVGALTVPFVIISGYVTALLYGLALSVVDGAIKGVVTDTVSAQATEYSWTLQNTTSTGHSKNVSGAKYYITDTKSAAKNKTYYEGYVPQDWGDQSLAVGFHGEMFGYSTWNVVGWA